MKYNLKNIRIDLDDLKTIQDEIDRGVYTTPQEVFDQIHSRIIEPQLKKHENCEAELRELGLDEAPYKGQYTGQEMLAVHRFIDKEILGE